MRRIFSLLLLMAAVVAVAAPRRARPAVDLDALWAAVEEARMDYRFDEALDLLDDYTDARTAARREADTRFGHDLADEMRQSLMLGVNMLERVRSIEITGTYDIVAGEYYDFINQAGIPGTLIAADISSITASPSAEPAYLSPEADFILYEEYSEDSGDAHGPIKQVWRLSDGRWDTPVTLFGPQDIFQEGNAAMVTTPFLDTDGTTLYFAADGDASLGGLDIFMTRRSDDGRYLQPLNLGMPFNSPANDFMMVLNPESGLGYWVSDRNHPGSDTLTVYAFRIPPEPRVNVDVNDPQLIDRATLDAPDAQEVSLDKANLPGNASQIPQRNTSSARPEPAPLVLPDGRLAYTENDLSTPRARTAMRDWLQLRDTCDSLRASLDEMRRAYAAGNRRIADRIRADEERLSQYQTDLQRQANIVISANER